MAHANTRLTQFGRLLLVQRITELGWPPSLAAESLGVSRATTYKWLGRYRSEGPAGLADRPSRPHHCPHALPASQVGRVLAANAAAPLPGGCVLQSPPTTHLARWPDPDGGPRQQRW
jgi:hypothetical protein